MVAAMRLAKPDPGSKKPDPATCVPLIVTFTEAWPDATVGGLAVEGVAGGGAISFTALTP
jgi:hypothetical protein